MLVDLLLPLVALNEVREEPVKVGYCVDRYAERWADKLAAENRWEHGLVEKARRKCGRPWVGQIMIRSQERMTMAESIPAWLASPAHREILLSPRADRVGVGRAHNEDYHFIVVNFASNKN
jgi:hypothetical protein